MARHDGMFHLIAFGLVILCIACLYYKMYLVTLYLILITGIYIAVGVNLDEAVKNASTHGNTVHGWYSKYNDRERTLATAWFYAFPFVAIVGPIFVGAKFAKGDNKKE